MKQIRRENRLHDRTAVTRGEILAVSDVAHVWINTWEIEERFTDNGDIELISEKIVKFEKFKVEVGKLAPSVENLIVTRIDPEWIEKEKQILKRNS